MSSRAPSVPQSSRIEATFRMATKSSFEAVSQGNVCIPEKFHSYAKVLDITNFVVTCESGVMMIVPREVHDLMRPWFEVVDMPHCALPKQWVRAGPIIRFHPESTPFPGTVWILLPVHGGADAVIRSNAKAKFWECSKAPIIVNNNNDSVLVAMTDFCELGAVWERKKPDRQQKVMVEAWWNPMHSDLELIAYHAEGCATCQEEYSSGKEERKQSGYELKGRQRFRVSHGASLVIRLPVMEKVHSQLLSPSEFPQTINLGSFSATGGAYPSVEVWMSTNPNYVLQMSSVDRTSVPPHINRQADNAFSSGSENEARHGVASHTASPNEARMYNFDVNVKDGKNVAKVSDLLWGGPTKINPWNDEVVRLREKLEAEPEPNKYVWQQKLMVSFLRHVFGICSLDYKIRDHTDGDKWFIVSFQTKVPAGVISSNESITEAFKNEVPANPSRAKLDLFENKNTNHRP